MTILQRIFGGWKTHGPNTTIGAGAFNGPLGTYDAVSRDMALRLSVVWACMNLRAETIGTLPVHIRDEKKKVLRDHDLFNLLHYSPNAMMTGAEFWSMQTAHTDMHGNAYSVVRRRTRDKSVISLEPINDPDVVSLEQRKGVGYYYEIDGEKFDPEDVLHLKGFSMSGLIGLSRLQIGRNILSAQLSANDAAMVAFKQGVKVGGFFTVEKDLDPKQIVQFKERLADYSKPENAGRFMTLLKGMMPIAGADFRPKPVDAELLSSRYFGIEEGCRLFGVPPQLIGHSDKASSWASSLENVNLFYLMYSIIPTLVRNEQRIAKTLLSREDKRKGISAKFGIQGLLRADTKTMLLFFASALQNGYYNRNEVRDLLDRGEIENGDEYMIQLNMGKATDTGDDDDKKDDKK